MFNLANVLELIIHRLNQRSFPQQNLVHQLEEALFHVWLGFGHELQAALIEFFKQLLAHVAPVPKELTEQRLGHLRHRFAVIGICRGELE